MKHWSDILKDMGACYSARRFAKRYKSPQAAWDACRVGSWMDWLCYELNRYMWDRKVRKRRQYFRENLMIRLKGFRRQEADLIRKFWPKAPKLPKTWKKT